MTVLRTIGLLLLAAVCEIGGAWLVWQGVREGRGLKFIAGGLVAGSLAWGMVWSSPRIPESEKGDSDGSQVKVRRGFSCSGGRVGEGVASSAV